MQIVFHIGAHQTDGGLLLRSLLKNSDLLLGEEIAVPGPSRYRKLIGQIVNSLRGVEPDPAMRETLLDAILDIDAPERLILSSESFICVPERVLEQGRLYARAFKTEWLRNLFPGHPVAFALALRNPATFVPALYEAQRLTGLRYDAFIGRTDPRSLRWSELVLRLRQINPHCPLVVWCDEDTPLIWPDILRSLTGIDAGIQLEGEDDMLGRVMHRAGLIRLHTRMLEVPDEDRARHIEFIRTLLEEHGIEDQMDVEIDLPGWSDELIGEMTQAYDADIEVIRAIPGVSLIEP